MKRAQKEEKGNVKFVEERIKRAARLLKEEEVDLKESSDEIEEEDSVPEEDDDGDNEVERRGLLNLFDIFHKIRF